MDESLLELLPVYGLPVLGLVVGLGCLGIPAPASLFILLAGSFAAAGDFQAATVFATCLAAALAADSLGYAIGRFGGARLLPRLGRGPAKARDLLAARGGMAVFFSRWLVAPLGPAINLVAGGAGMPWRRFLLFDLAGELVWVTLYMALGAAFSAAIFEIAALIANATASIAFAALAAGFGWLLYRRHRAHPQPEEG
jgi:membrane protein DedA with SNARE-associated domain